MPEEALNTGIFRVFLESFGNKKRRFEIFKAAF
jgi:hypothetical protein